MSDKAEVKMLLYFNLLPDERRLEAIDSAIATALIKAGQTDRAIWTSRAKSNHRVISLQVGQRAALQISPAELNTMSDDALLLRLQNWRATPS
jgi:hypothetical protein